jgi:hypothetical protein
MKNINTFEDFINESYLFEAMDLSEDLKKVKTPADLKAVVGNKTLIILSKHEPTNMKNRGGNWPRMNFVRGLDTNYIKIDDIGANERGSYLELNYIAFDGTGWSKQWTLEEIFEYFVFNKKRGNRIYTVDELPIKKDVKDLLDVQRSNMARVRTLLGNPVQVTTKANVANSKYVVTTDIANNHGANKIEFTANGKDYTYFYNVYGSDLPQLQTGRSTARAGYSSTVVYAVNAKTSAEILSLLESNIDVLLKAKKIAERFYKSEKINAAK